MKKLISRIRPFIIPVGLGVAAAITALSDNRKEEKIDQLIEKVDKLQIEKTIEETKEKVN